ncbi:unnamed protein product [Symbiodinium microadriaticum]|nr:unnamed protein product [Symbiodinium microadriaticum]
MQVAALDSSAQVEQLAVLRFFERREAALSKAFAGLLSQRLQDFLAGMLHEWRRCIDGDRGRAGHSPRPLPQIAVQFEAQIQPPAAMLDVSDRYVSSRQTSKSSTGAAAAAWDRFHEMDMDSEPEL